MALVSLTGTPDDGARAALGAGFEDDVTPDGTVEFAGAALVVAREGFALLVGVVAGTPVELSIDGTIRGSLAGRCGKFGLPGDGTFVLSMLGLVD
jgi:hypothetical protein